MRRIFPCAFLLVTLMTPFAFAESGAVDCPNPNDPKVPECPITGLLSEQYPISAVTVSTSSGKPKWASDYVVGVFRAQPDNPPLAYISATPEDYAKTVGLIRAQAPSKAVADRWVSRLRRPEVKPYNWQQDFFDSFHDPKTGQPELRQVDQYPNSRYPKQDFGVLAAAMAKDCPTSVGLPLKVDGTPVDGISGGNIEAAGDFCLIGRDHFKTDGEHANYAATICGKGEVIATPTQFLAAGHTDEIYKTIPLAGKNPPCNFAMAVASPRRAQELLKKTAEQDALPVDRDLITTNMTYRSMCEDYSRLQKERRRSPAPGTNSNGQSHLWEAVMNRFTAQAEEDIWLSCTKMKNKDLLDIVQTNPDIRDLNAEVQNRIDQFKTKFKERLAARYPGCNPPVIEVPQLFWGAANFEQAQALSIYPNPTNGEFVNGQYLVSQNANTVFAKDFEDQLKALGVKSTVIDTEFAHKKKGNLHCSSHAIRYCRPRGGK